MTLRRQFAALGSALFALGLGDAAATAAPAPAAPTIIHAGELLETPGKPPLEHASLVIVDGKVKAVIAGFVEPQAVGLPAGAKVIDLSTMFVMPGFIDLHVHLAGLGMNDRSLRKSDEYLTLVAAKNAETTLMAGFTTVRDLGSNGYTVLALRDAIKDGVTPGPKILASGDPISPTDGHGDNHGYREEIMAALPSRGVCDGADDCRRAVRAAVKRGADVIKVMASGGTLDESDAPTGQQFTDDELKAIADTAHMLGRKVTAHAHGKGAIDACIRAGFDSIEHGMWADEETLRTMKAKGVWLIPTVWPIDYVGDTPEKVRNGPMKNLPEVSLNKLIALGSQPKKLVRQAHAIGVRIALGTDAGVYPHGQNAHEFIEYVDAGMSPMQALVAGTSDAAEAGGVKGVGKLEPGMAADVVALPASPLKDINAVLDVPFVMRDGVLFKEGGAPKPAQRASLDPPDIQDAF
jgi:imidazolonepropionase-like amidohydrolase